ncbi:undecaprenyl-diphosphatase [Nocardia sp. 852002-20019_SCH5090214]|jgi:undecaprenyl-diphosphatase|uniref:Undecaprenyl-diphosphatase n=1 Tax=Nocardia nova TaxID=37330 RepID=A0A2S6A8W6_9NOCA|nr:MULTISPECIES: undecaprenyl-diphosphate phosphatase [Nocardia]OBF79606.1 undecaprenyl-diphosphatase [Mycobacterium sp. 852002-51759_SCH5129042]MBF6278016.1 undecaprenyl-diphosphate phosphatase [Nocardia nova]MBV7704332.1 undecaprenyl-diphosphate phosphatase [Nocardia nova]OBA53619.1 undecaprenyl-diphosphatase [Nocardia sp. 852002-51101_SCH5132738]OBA67106.1 undecaprenyl-diphosphatase [Nocardia sp. 852002-20019_SCH5090214]
MLTYFQAIVIGALQGVTELFPISSLGHSVLVPAWLGGSWEKLVTEGDSDNGTPYLAFVVALHVATALALLGYYWRDWRDIIIGFVTTLRTRRIETSSQRLAWLIVLATIPVGVLGLLLEHPLRTLFATPIYASIFLTLNGVVLIVGEGLRRRNAPSLAEYGRRFAADEARADAQARGVALQEDLEVPSDERLAALSVKDALGIGLAQSGALLAGFSRSGLTMVGGLLRGLDHEDTAKFAFLLATPVILAAGVLKLPELAGPQAAGIHGQALVGAIVAGIAAWLAVRFLERFFKSRTLLPFAVYCLVAGLLSIIRFI